MSTGEGRSEDLLKNLEPDTNPERVERWLGRLHRRMRRRRTARLALGGATLAASLALAGLYVVRQGHRAATAEHTAASPAASATPLVLADGSTIERFGDARVVVAHVAPDRVGVRLDYGRIVATVVHRPGREFVVTAGAFEIAVVGTRFQVVRIDKRLTVSVERGQVRVRSTDGSTRELRAGEVAEFAEPAVTPSSSAAAPPETVSDLADEAARTVPRGVPASPAQPATLGSSAARSWRSLANDGVYDEAYRRLEQGEPVGDTVEDLLLAADAARLSGHADRALPHLSRIVSAHSSDARAPMAAYTRGLILLGLGSPGPAAASFDRARAMGAQGSLRENALARAVEAHSRAGNAAAAATLAREYVDMYPQGRWLASVRQHGRLEESASGR
jgi:transmembrane sensor